MTYSSCQNKGPVILKVKKILHKRRNKSTIKFSDVQGCCNNNKKIGLFLKIDQLEDKFIVVSIELHNKQEE